MVLHCLQLLPHTPHRDAECHKYMNMNPGQKEVCGGGRGAPPAAPLRRPPSVWFVSWSLLLPRRRFHAFYLPLLVFFVLEKPTPKREPSRLSQEGITAWNPSIFVSTEVDAVRSSIFRRQFRKHLASRLTSTVLMLLVSQNPSTMGLIKKNHERINA